MAYNRLMASSVYRELMRRRVFRVAVPYILAAWIIVQVADVLLPALQLPEWAVTLVAAFLVLGFPVVMVLAWAFDIGPAGITRTQVSSTSTTRAILAFGVLLTGGAALLFFLLNREGSVTQTMFFGLGVVIVTVAAFLFLLLYQRGQAHAAPGVSEAAESIAVLPFVNSSGDESNDYFSDGMTEELINVLQSVEGLRVAARASSFYFKGRKEKVQTIGDELNVDHVLEGSVRKSGDRIRISVQLVNAVDGFNVWTQAFDRELDDVMEVQNDVARAVADALQLRISGGREAAAPESTQAYELYLRGMHLWRRREARSIRQAIEAFRGAVELEPGFAKAHAALGAAQHKLPVYDIHADSDWQELAESSTREALRIKPDLAEAHATLGSILSARHRYMEAEAAFRKARDLHSDDVTVHHWYAAFLLVSGRLRRALGEINIAHERDPLNATVAGTRGEILFAGGQLEEAENNLHEAETLGWGPAAHAFLARLRFHQRDWKGAGECLNAAEIMGEGVPDALVEAIMGTGGRQESATGAILASHRSSDISSVMAFWLLSMTGSTELFDLKLGKDTLRPELVSTLWHPTASPIRADPRFMKLMNELGLPELWRTYGTPDKCRVLKDTFVCT